MATLTRLRRPTSSLTTASTVLRPLHKMASRAQHTFRTHLVPPSELASALRTNPTTPLSTSPRVIPLCGTWFLPNSPHPSPLATFLAARPPGARFFDLDAVADTHSPYPHMLPSPQVFSQAMQQLGINRDDVVVVYDSSEQGLFSAPRVAWTLRAFGHPSVHILNNFRMYVQQGLPLESGEPAEVKKSPYPTPELDESMVATFERVKGVAQDALKEGHEPVQILDARSTGRWAGTDAEPRPGLSSGHIPGSISVPLPDLLHPEDKTLLDGQALREVFEKAGVQPGMPVIASCGTGVMASVVDAALMEAGWGEGERRVYDGSWTEWAQRVRPEENLIWKVKVEE